MGIKYILIIFILFTSKSFSCSCPPPILKHLQKTEVENSECIFIGEVLSIDFENYTYEIKVIESFNNDGIEGNIYIGENLKYCSPIIGGKGKWIVYGNFDNDFFSVNECGITRPFEYPITSHPPPPFTQYEKDNYEVFKKDELENAKIDLCHEVVALRERKKRLHL